jgi:hypothetical protein
MVEATVSTQIVIFTHDYSISGGLFLNERRLSDFLNDRRDTTILLRNAGIARLEEPAKILEKTTSSIIPKAGIVLVFEPPQPINPANRRLIKYPKAKYDIFLATDGLEIHGHINLLGPLDLRQAIMNAAESFIPITEASVTFKVNPVFVLKQDAVLVNAQRIRFMGEVDQPKPAKEKTRGSVD